MTRKEKDLVKGVGIALAEVYRRNDDDVTVNVTEVAKALNYGIGDFTEAGLDEDDPSFLARALNDGIGPPAWGGGDVGHPRQRSACATQLSGGPSNRRPAPSGTR